MPATGTVTVDVKTSDLPAVKALIEELEAKLERAEKEAEEWENRYEDLLSECGGTSPR